MTNCLDENQGAPGNGRRVPVSVVIPCYSCAETIGRAMESVVEQTALPAEVWLVEDGSPDDGRTLEALHRVRQRYNHEIPIQVIPLGGNFGSGVARNAGWDAATQPYVAFLDADDSWHPSKIDVQYNWMQAHPDVAMSGHQWTLGQQDKSKIALPDELCARKISPRMLLIANRFSTPTVMIRTNLPYRFNVGKNISEDIALWLEIVLDGNTVWFLEASLAYLYKAPYGDSGRSGNLWAMEKGELRAFWAQVRGGRLGLMGFMMLAPFLLAKFVRRVVITSFWDRQRQ